MIPTIRTDAPFPRCHCALCIGCAMLPARLLACSRQFGGPLEHSQWIVNSGHRRHGLLRQGVHPPRARRRSTAGWSSSPATSSSSTRSASSSTTTRGCAGSSATSATGTGSTRAMHGVDYVVHAAALKQVDTAEYNPFEFVQTNVIGSQNVIEARHRRRRQEGRRALHRQGLQPDQPLRRDQADRRQAVRHRQPLRRRHPTRFSRGPLRQRDGQPRLGDPVLPRAGRRRASRCRSPTSG